MNPNYTGLMILFIYKISSGEKEVKLCKAPVLHLPISISSCFMSRLKMNTLAKF